MFVQAILVTDGNVSFTLLLYEDITTCSNNYCVAGFDAGDTITSTTINRNQSNIFQKRNIFRIDGKSIMSISPSVCAKKESILLTLMINNFSISSLFKNREH